MTAGSVDDGKSTLLGKILFETDNLFTDQGFEMSKQNEKYGKAGDNFDYSLLLDGLIDEKKQGITIDLAYKYFSYKSKKFIFIDSPGHIEFTRNVANAATVANVALVLIDIENGVTPQTATHLELISLFPNIQKTFICINKIDSISSKVSKFKKIKKDVSRICENLEINIEEILPVSAITGENINWSSKNKNLYSGKNLLEFFEELKIVKERGKKNNLVKINFVMKNSKNDRVAYAKNFYKKIKKGDVLVNIATQESTKVQKIYYDNSAQHEVEANSNFSFSFNPQISFEKGDVLVQSDGSKLIDFSNSFKAKVVWTHSAQPLKSKRYIYKFGTRSIYGFISNIQSSDNAKDIISNHTVELENKYLISSYLHHYEFSRFLIIDPQTFDTLGFGYVEYSLDRGSNISKETFPKATNINPVCLWLTGLSGSGKSTLAHALAVELKKRDIPFYNLDGDTLRSTINKDLGFSESDRSENLRRTAHIAKILQQAGVLPIVSTISPSAASREFARSLFEEDIFYEVYIKASLKECIRRDPKKIYSNEKKIKNITGLHAAYEEPLNPDLIIDTVNSDVSEGVNMLLKLINKTKINL